MEERTKKILEGVAILCVWLAMELYAVAVINGGFSSEIMMTFVILLDCGAAIIFEILCCLKNSEKQGFFYGMAIVTCCFNIFLYTIF